MGTAIDTAMGLTVPGPSSDSEVDGCRIGVAPGVTKAFIGKVLGDDGQGSSIALFDGLQWAFAMGADVISMSLGFPFATSVGKLVANEGLPMPVAASQVLQTYRQNLRAYDALLAMFRRREDGWDDGSVVVAASGNESDRRRGPNWSVDVGIPAAGLDVLSVGAVERAGKRFKPGYFSNTNPNVCAPGVDILSAQAGGGLEIMSGTSQACPHVAGIAALWWESADKKGFQRKASIVAERIRSSAKPKVFAAGTTEVDRGAGLVVAP